MVGGGTEGSRGLHEDTVLVQFMTFGVCERGGRRPAAQFTPLWSENRFTPSWSERFLS